MYLHDQLRQQGPLRIVFVCTNVERRSVEQWFVGGGCSRQAPLAIDFVSLDEGVVFRGIAALKITSKGPLDHHSGLGGALKIFLPQVLANYTKVIMI